MYLLTLAILSAALGYFLAGGRFGSYVDRLSARLRRRDAFRQWALGAGARLWPADFKRWLAGLSEAEANHFHHALDEYANSLGFQLDRLMDGSLEHDPMMRQVFVEAVVVYSPAYRKVRQAQQEAAQQTEKPLEPDAQPGNGAAPKNGKSNGNQETPEAAAAD